MKNPVVWLFIVSIYAAALTGFVIGDKRLTDALPSKEYIAQVESTDQEGVRAENKLWTDPEKPSK